MPEIKYYKDMNHNYLIIKCQGEPAGDKYQLKMITANKIAGLLSCSTRFINGDIYLYYEVNSLQALTTLYEYKKMDKLQAVRILTGFRRVLREIQAYLLVDNGLLLRPEYIYVNWEQEEVYFVYYPYETEREENTVQIFMEFLVTVIDHRDEQLVEMVYGLCQLAERGRFVADELDYYLENLYYDQPDQSRTQAQPWPSDHRPSRYRTETIQGQAVSTKDRTVTALRTKPMKGRETSAIPANTMQDWVESATSANTMKEQTVSARTTKTLQGRTTVTEPSEFPSDLPTGETVYVPSMGKKQKVKYMIMTVVSLVGAVAVLYIRSHYLLTPQESLLTWILLFTFLFIFIITGLLYLLLRFSTCTEKKPIPQEYRPEAEQVESEPAAFTPEMPTVEKYGDTVFLYSAEEIRENKLYGISKGNKYHINLSNLPCTIGKMADCADYCITEASISRMHVKFTGKENAIYMTDLNSTNGTYKNGLRLQPSETVPIEPGDEIRLGKLIFSYR